MKVYIITEGSYSDYHIERIFSSQELAKKYCSDNPDECIEEWEVDTLCTEINRKYYKAVIRIDSGELISLSALDWGSGFGWDVADMNRRVREVHNTEAFNYKEAIRDERGFFKEPVPIFNLIVASSFVSKEHAEKLAIEARQEYLRVGSLTADYLDSLKDTENEERK